MLSNLANLLPGVGSVLAAILVLGVIIFLHELGHFSAARILGLPVDEFAVGFGPALWKWQRGETRYSVRVLPIGGFCAFYGEDKDNPDPRAFNNHPAWKRFAAIFSGPLMNFIAGFLITLLLLTVVGQKVTIPIIDSVESGAPAQAAGILPGDEIIGVNGEDMQGDPAAIQNAIRQNGLNSTQVLIERSGEMLELTLTPFYDEELGYARIGILFGDETLRMGVGPALGASWRYCVDMGGEMLRFFRDLFFHGQGAGEVAGPIGTISIISQNVSQGVATIMNLAVLISINLGLVNLLPLPALDGGRLVFLLIEIVFRKPVPREKEAWVHVGGLVLLLGAIAIFTVRDIARLFGIGA